MFAEYAVPTTNHAKRPQNSGQEPDINTMDKLYMHNYMMELLLPLKLKM